MSTRASLAQRLYVAATRYRDAWLGMKEDRIKTAALQLESAARAYKGFVERFDTKGDA